MTTPITEVYNVSRIFPWLRYLSSEQLTEFYTDFFRALEQAIHTKEWSLFEETIESWHATAEILADADLTAILTQTPSDDDSEIWDDVEAELFDKAP